MDTPTILIDWKGMVFGIGEESRLLLFLSHIDHSCQKSTVRGHTKVLKH